MTTAGSPLLGEPVFPFGWALRNTSTHCMITFWLGCMNYALGGNLPSLRRLLQDIFIYALLCLSTVNLSLNKLLPSYTISFTWKKRLLEPKFSCDQHGDERSFILYSFRGEGDKIFPSMKTYFLQYRCIVVHCKELVKVYSPPFQFTFNKNKTKSLKMKMKVVYLQMSITYG